jgi:hypothetical protein
MGDNLLDLFEQINQIDQPQPNQSGSYARREMKVEVANGVERVLQITRIQIRNPDGFLNVIEEIRCLCQGCNSAWVSPGDDNFTNENRILCQKCSRKTKFLWFSKPFWGFFIKDGKK